MAEETYTMKQYLAGSVNVPVPEEALVSIMAKRGIDPGAEFSSADAKTRDLLYADLLVWIAMGVSRQGAVSDSDNGWSHSDGGYTLTDGDKRRMLAEANGIYEKYDEPMALSTRIRVVDFGIKKANRDFAWRPLPIIEK